MSLFNPDSEFWAAVGKCVDYVLLNILCLLFMLPIVTAGAAMTAKYYVLNTGKESFLRGDVDENGQVNGVDGNIEKQLLAGIIIPDEDMKMYGDVNLDMEINAKDSNLLKQIISGVVSFK